MSTTKKKKKITLSEFRAWLEGVEELQSVDWSPSKEQWQLIRDKIDSIVIDTKPSSNKSESQPAERQQVVGYNQPAPPMMIPHESAFRAPVPELQHMPFEPEMTPAARQMLSGGPPIPTSPSGKLQTPNIDTSSGAYNSGFE